MVASLGRFVFLREFMNFLRGEARGGVRFCNHTFRGTGITAYLANDGDLLDDLNLELATVPSSGLSQLIIMLLEPLDSYLGVRFFGGRSTGSNMTVNTMTGQLCAPVAPVSRYARRAIGNRTTPS